MHNDAAIYITPTATASRCGLTINGALWASGAAYLAQLEPGANRFLLPLTLPVGTVQNA